MREIQKERLVLIGLDKLACLRAQPIGEILALFGVHQIRILIRTVIATTTGATPFAPSNVDIKPLRGRILTQMPFAHGGRHISSFLQYLSNSLKAIGQHRVVLDRYQLAKLRLPTIRVTDRKDPMPRPIQTAHQARATGRTIRRTRVGVHKHHALLRQPVDMRRLIIFRAHERQIRPAQVVDEIKNNVRLSRLRADAGQQHDQQCTNRHPLFCAELGAWSRFGIGIYLIRPLRKSAEMGAFSRR